MSERGDVKDADVEMPEYGPLLGEDEDAFQQPRPQQQPSKYRRLVEWLPWGIVILFCLALISDNISLRRMRSSESAFDTDLSTSN